MLWYYRLPFQLLETKVNPLFPSATEGCDLGNPGTQPGAVPAGEAHGGSGLDPRASLPTCDQGLDR